MAYNRSYCSHRTKDTKSFEKNKIYILRARIQKIIANRLNTSSVLRYSQDTQVKNDSTVDDPPIRSIISNINTASYQVAKYLAKLLSPLSMSEYTVKSTSDFSSHIKGQNIPNSFKLISFDVTSLFTNVPLDFTIDVILKRIYDENEVNTNIPKQQMRDLLLLCTKNVHFSYNGDIYTQADGVATGSPLGPVLAGIFMVELERTILPTLKEHMIPRKRYVYDTISYIKKESIEHVLSKLNVYHV